MTTKTKSAPGTPIIFARLIKIDEATRTVFGRAVQEVPDQSKEIFDYDSSKPNFEKWMTQTKDASLGKSLGNVRAMHGKVAAGKLTGVEFNDTEKAIDVAAKVVDDAEWKKCQEGVYTGFSIGGSYVRKWKDPVNPELDRYEAAPTELSLVDNPCVPTATFFTITKADGTSLQKSFQLPADAGKKPAPEDESATGTENKPKGDANASEDDAAADAKAGEGSDASPPAKTEDKPAAKAAVSGDVEYEVNGDPEDVAELQKTMNDGQLTVKDVNSILAKVAAGDWSGLFQLEAQKAVFADPENKRFPLDTVPQIKAALYYANQPAAKALYSEESHANILKAIEAAYIERVEKTVPTDLEKAVTEEDLAKSFYMSGELAKAIDSLYWLVSSACYSYADGGPAAAITKCKLAVSSLADALVELVGHDAANIKFDKVADTEGAQRLAKRVGEIAKLTEVTPEMVEKIGMRNNKADMERIQKVHDAAVELSARCMKKNPAGFFDEEDPAKAASDDLSKLAGNPELAKVLTAALEKATAPLRAEIEKLKAAPAPARVALRAVSKAGDTTAVDASQGTRVEPVLTNAGQVDEVATLIKGVHQSGGQPLVKRG